MSLTETILEGTIQPDGTLVLDKKLNLRPGRVKAVLQQEAEAKPLTEDWWQYLQRVRAEREAIGYPFMNEQEMNAHMEWLRTPDQIDEMLHETDERRGKAVEP